MDSAALRTAGNAFEGLLLEQLLAPLTSAFGEAAPLVAGPLASTIAQHDAHGFGALLAQTLARRV